VTWEYRILTATNALADQDLNQLGDEGWELVGLTSSNSGTGETEIVCVFKREKSTQLPFGASAQG
jgi:Domain of unknown function (DUF4177)